MTDSKPVPKQQKYLERDQESILPTNEIIPSAPAAIRGKKIQNRV
jgi:hypothetical protein